LAHPRADAFVDGVFTLRPARIDDRGLAVVGRSSYRAELRHIAFSDAGNAVACLLAMTGAARNVDELPSDDSDSIYKVDTVPPPDGEDDAYNATTRVGPMALAYVGQLMAEADAADAADEPDAPETDDTDATPMSGMRAVAPAPAHSQVRALGKPRPPRMPSATLPPAPLVPMISTVSASTASRPPAARQVEVPRLYDDGEEGNLFDPTALLGDASLDARFSGPPGPPGPPGGSGATVRLDSSLVNAAIAKIERARLARQITHAPPSMAAPMPAQMPAHISSIVPAMPGMAPGMAPAIRDNRRGEVVIFLVSFAAVIVPSAFALWAWLSP
jgi:hypothetical protein